MPALNVDDPELLELVVPPLEAKLRDAALDLAGPLKDLIARYKAGELVAAREPLLEVIRQARELDKWASTLEDLGALDVGP